MNEFLTWLGEPRWDMSAFDLVLVAVAAIIIWRTVKK